MREMGRRYERNAANMVGITIPESREKSRRVRPSLWHVRRTSDENNQDLHARVCETRSELASLRGARCAVHGGVGINLGDVVKSLTGNTDHARPCPDEEMVGCMFDFHIGSLERMERMERMA